MGTYVTDTGLKRKTLQEVRLELENGFRRVFGPSFETSVDSPNGLLITELSVAIGKLWELAQEVFISRDPAQATGISLDFAAALNGLFRKTSTACKVGATLFTLEESVLIPAGSTALRVRGNQPFSLDNDVQIDRRACKELFIYDDGSRKSTGYVFHFTFGDVTLNNTSESIHNLNALGTAIQAAGGHCDFVTGNVSDGLRVYDTSGGLVGITGTMPDDFKIYAAEEGSFTCTEEGEQTCEIGELDTIQNPVDGWDKVYNFATGIPGTNTESDNQFRVRREASAKSIKSTGTDPSIAAHLLNEVEGVTSASVRSNRKMTEDAEGRPPKSFETFVAGGRDEDVAMVIFKNQPSGIESYGNTSVTITDENLDEQIIKFSRPVEKYLWIKVTYTLYNEEVFPGKESLKSSILDWAAEEYKIGRDVIAERIYSALYPPYIEGVGKATVQIAVTSTPTGTPSYNTNPVSIGWSEYASVTPERITLVSQGT